MFLRLTLSLLLVMVDGLACTMSSQLSDHSFCQIHVLYSRNVPYHASSNLEVILPKERKINSK